jgi:hypothetical protein
MEATNTKPVWTPDTNPSDLPKDRGPYGPQRVYFYDLVTRQELKDHPLNGMVWAGSGAMVTHQGQYVDGTAGCVYGTVWLQVDGKPSPRRVDVTQASFPGQKVVAKVWLGDLAPDWRVLATGDGSKPTKDGRYNGKLWAAAYKRGEVG